MIIKKICDGRFTYGLDRHQNEWSFIRASGNREQWFPLDLDKRHGRLFLEPEDQREVGIRGLKALEKMARSVLTRT